MLVYENSVDIVGYCQIKDKVVMGAMNFSSFTKIQTVKSNKLSLEMIER